MKKDLEAARRLYLAAADKGNAKAMHNLAVLYAEGIDGKPDYETAAQWFRKAADHGVADSQYNLGILYARGIGVEHNLAESYKWFALAAARATRTPARSATTSPPGSMPQRSPPPTRGADLDGRAAARRARSTSSARPAAGTRPRRRHRTASRRARHRDLGKR